MLVKVLKLNLSLNELLQADSTRRNYFCLLILVPPEYGLKWKLDYKVLIDTKNFIEDYLPVKFSTPDCQYEWEIFRKAEERLTEENWFQFQQRIFNSTFSKS